MVAKTDVLAAMTHEEKLSLLAALLEATDIPDVHADPDPEVFPPRTPVEHPVSELRFELLGPLVIRHGHRDVAPSAPKLRLILATLLFNANKPVGASALIKELWGDDAPRTAHATLQTYMFKLRRLFRVVLGLSVEHVTNEVLQTCSGGYILRVDPSQLDITEFEQLVTSGSAAMHAGDHERAADSLRRSLALWRGTVVHPGQWGTGLRAQVARLEERRFYAHTTRIDADLCLGRHRETISELASLVVEHPLHESAHAMLMLALYRSGRTSAALEVYLRFRQRMLHELGIEPSERIQALQMALLSTAPVLANHSLTSDMLLDRLARSARPRHGSSAVTGA
ncbi:AfsR/SARP family transcriptional regulator [Actinophytocola oryzae]|uniref:DNA-binding SARP family transcriptional activator n=1 Tax=Actinophytocola oryzae TaxID=502181 RepID=A0A4R7VUU2_9PSEU|nr:AfsR/SARP family transcriptional regulator [Actinophytocola oryzae]TDV53624.1 DNA-binding SARP family transcriptional activator [Actinophytocola oryzae]